MQDRIFYSICFGFLVGVLLRSFIFVNFYVAVLVGFLSLVVFLLFLLTGEKRWGIIISVFIFTLSLGILRFHGADVLPPQAYELAVGEKVTFAGQLIDEPVVSANNQKLTVETKHGGQPTKILLSAGFEEEYRYGDEVHFSGILKKPENFMTEQSKEFDYINYLRKDGVRYVISYADVDIVSRGHGNPVKEILFYVKNKFLEKINFAVASPENLLMGGLLLGERAAWSSELRQSFIDTGTIHIVALSGYNVTIVAEWIMKFFSFMPRNFAFGSGIFAIFLFIIMTGANSTAVRAGIMATLALVARATGRDYDVARAMFLAAAGMVFINPFILAYDVSFQLSFLATMAVIFFAPRIEKHFFWVTKKFGLRDIFSVTAAAYLFVFPFILYKMGNFSAIALPANVLVLPFIPITMAAGFLTGLLGIIWHGLAVPFGFIAYILLHYELGVIKILSAVPFAAFTIPYFPLILTILIYLGFIHFLFGVSIKNFFTKQF
ncbi:MAG: ComEC family competence protein [bacterium]|nr:ComEC family competence protein [bacterium]